MYVREKPIHIKTRIITSKNLTKFSISVNNDNAYIILVVAKVFKINNETNTIDFPIHLFKIFIYLFTFYSPYHSNNYTLF